MYLCILICFPKYLVLSFYQEWITLREFGGLDSALCNVMSRPTFLSCVCSSSESFILPRNHKFTAQYLKWLSTRNYPLDSLSIGHVNLNKMFGIAEHPTANKLVHRFKSFLGLGTRSISANETHSFNGLSHFNLSGCYGLLPETLVVIGKTCYSTLKTLILDDCSRITDFAIGTMAQSCVLLQELSLSECFYVTDVGVTVVVSSCKQIVSLNLFNCIQITDKALVAIATHCSRLTQLNIAMSESHTFDQRFASLISDDGILSLAMCCSSIRNLNLDHRSAVTVKGIQHIALHYTQLVEISMLNITLDDITYSLLCENNSHSLVKLVIWFSNPMQYIDNKLVQFPPQITQTMQSLAKCTQLTALEFYNCRFSHEEMQQVVINCTELKDLKLSACACIDEKMLQMLAFYCADSLTSLSLCMTPCFLAEEQSVEPPQNTIGLPYFPHLERLLLLNDNSFHEIFLLVGVKLQYIVFPAEKQPLQKLTEFHWVPSECTTQRLCEIMKDMPQLTSLSLSTGVTDDLLLLLSPNYGRIRSLEVSNSYEICGDGLVSIAKYCTALQSVNISNCRSMRTHNVIWFLEACGSQLTTFISSMETNPCFPAVGSQNSLLITIGKHCKALTHLDLSISSYVKTDGLTDFAMRRMTSGCDKLRKLKLRYNQMSKYAFDCIVKHCELLVYLDISHCLSAKHVVKCLKVKEHLPLLRVLRTSLAEAPQREELKLIRPLVLCG